ncbi:MAG: polysaccharide biosynthesis tyrosine autokinase [Eubacteriales bacterium]|nr:polysaccharide biosynthesis tyrosine autokinase [Eubacteriales bacterium]
MQEISIKDILTYIRKHLVWVIIVPLVVAAAAGYYFMGQPNTYTAQTKLYVLMEYVDSLGQTRYDTSTSSQFAGDFSDLIQTNQVKMDTINRLGGDETMLDDVDIEVQAVSNTRVINVNVTSIDPDLSYRVANTISQVFVEYITQVTKTDSVSIAEQATLPDEPSGPARLRNIALAFLAALVLVIGVILAIEMLNPTFRTVEEIESTLEIPVLASVRDYRDAMNKRADHRNQNEPITEILPTETVENVKTLSTNVQFASLGTPVRNIMITSTMSTEGKSSLSLFLAEALAEEGFSVLLCDFDVRRPSIGQLVGKRNRVDIIDYLSDKASLKEVAMAAGKKGVWFTDMHHRISYIAQIANHPNFDRFLKESKEYFDYVLFDTSPLGMFIDAAVLAARVDGTLLVVARGLVDRDNVKDTLGQLKKANANLLGVVMNYAEQRKGGRYYYGKYSYGSYGKSGGYGYEGYGEHKERKRRKQRQPDMTEVAPDEAVSSPIEYDDPQPTAPTTEETK